MSIKPKAVTLDENEDPFQDSNDVDPPTDDEDKIEWQPEVVRKKIPPFVTRSEWGAREPTNPRPAKKELLKVYLTMWTDSEECHTREECIKTMQELQRRDMDEQGLSDIKYNFLVGGDGAIYEGRGWKTKSSKVLEFNPRYYHDRLDIAYIGDFRHVQHPPIRQLEVGQDWILYGEWMSFIHSVRDVLRLSGENKAEWVKNVKTAPLVYPHDDDPTDTIKMGGRGQRTPRGYVDCAHDGVAEVPFDMKNAAVDLIQYGLKMGYVNDHSTGDICILQGDGT